MNLRSTYLIHVTRQAQGTVEFINRLKIPPIAGDYAQEIKRILTRHWCTIEHHPDYDIITFPEETRRWRGMRLVTSERYYIDLPDGYTIYESYDAMREESLLSFPREVPR